MSKNGNNDDGDDDDDEGEDVKPTANGLRSRSTPDISFFSEQLTKMSKCRQQNKGRCYNQDFFLKSNRRVWKNTSKDSYKQTHTNEDLYTLRYASHVFGHSQAKKTLNMALQLARLVVITPKRHIPPLTYFKHKFHKSKTESLVNPVCM